MSARELPKAALIGPRRSDAAFRQIIALLHEGRFTPGDRLPAERDLAELLHVSRPTLRDALNRLEARGFIDRKTGSGSYVCTSIPESIRTPLEEGIRERLITLQQIIDVRKPLEVWAAKEAAIQRTADQLGELHQALESMRAAGKKVDKTSNTEYARADIRFHLVLAKMTKNPVYVHMLQFLTELISTSLSISREILDDDFSKANTTRHEAIYESIAAQAPSAARKAMTAHFLLIERRIRDLE
jgi:GntR family transcriptional repressor for pyruvate dehydrogenase complex